MYLIREVMNCKPGKVGEMKKKFKAISTVMTRMNYKPFRIFTDVSGEQFWTLVAESEAKTFDDFLAMENKVMGDPEAQKAMAGYHELVERGRREIYKIEA